LNNFNTVAGALLFRGMVGQGPLQAAQCMLCNLGRQETHTILPHEVMLREEEASWLARVLHMLQCTQSPVDFDMVSTQANGLKPLKKCIQAV